MESDQMAVTAQRCWQFLANGNGNSLAVQPGQYWLHGFLEQ